MPVPLLPHGLANKISFEVIKGIQKGVITMTSNRNPTKITLNSGLFKKK